MVPLNTPPPSAYLLALRSNPVTANIRPCNILCTFAGLGAYYKLVFKEELIAPKNQPPRAYMDWGRYSKFHPSKFHDLPRFSKSTINYKGIPRRAIKLQENY